MKKIKLNTDIMHHVADCYSRTMGPHFRGIIFCGSITNDMSALGDDIDYLLIIDTESGSTLQEIATIGADLNKKLGKEIGSTILTTEQLANITTNYLQTDGKAVQTVIKANDDAVYANYDQQLVIPKLNKAQIKHFSRNNYYTLRSLLMKHIVRSSAPILDEEKRKMLKISLIMIKMAAQSGSTVGKNYQLDGLREDFMELRNGEIRMCDEEFIDFILQVCELLPTNQATYTYQLET